MAQHAVCGYNLYFHHFGIAAGKIYFEEGATNIISVNSFPRYEVTAITHDSCIFRFPETEGSETYSVYFFRQNGAEILRCLDTLRPSKDHRGIARG